MASRLYAAPGGQWQLEYGLYLLLRFTMCRLNEGEGRGPILSQLLSTHRVETACGGCDREMVGQKEGKQLGKLLFRVAVVL